jgi:hypothetical protein
MRNKFNPAFFSWTTTLLIPFIITGVILLIGAIVMLLWNGIMPSIFGLGVITVWQAIGLFILTRFLTGNYRKGNKKHHHYAYCSVQQNDRDKVQPH